VDFEIDDFIDVLGGKQNIINSSTTVSTLKVNLKDASFLNKESFVKFKITGFMKNANQIILVFGDNAKAIDNILVKKLKD
jgi:phosphotransferase system IIB component